MSATSSSLSGISYFSKILIDGVNSFYHIYNKVQRIEFLPFYLVSSFPLRESKVSTSRELKELLSVEYRDGRYYLPDFDPRHVKLFTSVEKANEYWSELQNAKLDLF